MYNRRQYGNIFEPFHILECSKPLLFTFRKKGLWNQVFDNRMIIDAKSLLGVLSLDLTKILTVEFDGENTPFEEFLERKNPMHAVA